MTRFQTEVPIYGHTSTLLDTGEVIVVGGWPWTANAASRNATLVLNPPPRMAWFTRQWKGNVPRERHFHSAASSSDGRRLVVYGGWRGSQCLSDVVSLDSRTGVWTRLSRDNRSESVVECRAGHSAVLISNTQMLVFGGMAQNGKSTGQFVLYQLTDTTYRTELIKAPNAPTARSFHGTVLNGNTLFIFGGSIDSVNPLSDGRLYMFNTVLRTWTSEVVPINGPTDDIYRRRPLLKSGVFGHVMQLVDGDIIIQGGYTFKRFNNHVLRYSISRRQWSRIDNEEDVAEDDDAESFDRKPKSPSDAPAPIPARSAASFVQNGLLFIIGGMTESGASSDIGIYDGENVQPGWTNAQIESVEASVSDGKTTLIFIGWGLNADVIDITLNDAYGCLVTSQSNDRISCITSDITRGSLRAKIEGLNSQLFKLFSVQSETCIGVCEVVPTTTPPFSVPTLTTRSSWMMTTPQATGSGSDATSNNSNATAQGGLDGSNRSTGALVTAIYVSGGVVGLGLVAGTSLFLLRRQRRVVIDPEISTKTIVLDHEDDFEVAPKE